MHLYNYCIDMNLMLYAHIWLYFKKSMKVLLRQDASLAAFQQLVYIALKRYAIFLQSF